MTKRICRKLAIVLTMVMLLTCFAYAVPVNAASSGDLAKANVKWDLKNNKSLKFKTKWYSVGVKQHTVKMTDYKVTKASKKGYKQCTFKLTYTLDINPTKKQINRMAGHYTDYGTFGGGFYYTVVDYKTGKSLEGDNDKDVTVTDNGWKHLKYNKKKGTDGAWISFASKTTVKVKIIYPEDYKGLCIGVGGYTTVDTNVDSYWAGNKKYSKTTKLYSKKDKSYAHFKRVK